MRAAVRGQTPWDSRKGFARGLFAALVVFVPAAGTIGCHGRTLDCSAGTCGEQRFSPSATVLSGDTSSPIIHSLPSAPDEEGPVGTPAAPSEPGAPIEPETPTSPTLAGCPIFPPDSPWNQDVSNAAVDPNSDRYLSRMNASSRTLQFYFGYDPIWGVPITIVGRDQPRVPITFDYPSQSDPGPYPVPLDARVEGGPDGYGDRHIIVLDAGRCLLYELFNAWRSGAGYHAGSGAFFDLWINHRRPEGWTSADAAGLPILPGLIRRDEIAAGEIRHALRFTVENTQRAYVEPATHYASWNTDSSFPPMGLRVRLKADFDISAFPRGARIVLAALKKYGMFLADNGRDWAISGESAAWDDRDFFALQNVPATAFEVVKHGPVYR